MIHKSNLIKIRWGSGILNKPLLQFRVIMADQAVTAHDPNMAVFQVGDTVKIIKIGLPKIKWLQAGVLVSVDNTNKKPHQ